VPAAFAVDASLIAADANKQRSAAGSPRATQDICDAARAVNSEVIVLSHGGPMEYPQDVAYVLERTTVQGFVGASSIERLPVEEAIVGTVKAFRDIPLPPAARRT
jgi:predicted TIM-barrel enzyme